MLSACGDALSAPAAVVDGSRISTDTLGRELDVLLLDPQLRQQVSGARGDEARKDLTRRLLAFLIQLRLVEGYATANAISVTSAEVDLALERTIQGIGGQSEFDRELRTRGLSLGAVRRNLERQVLFDEVIESLAARAGFASTASRQEKESAFQEWMTGRLRSADIEVNPRFGRLDPASGRVVPIRSTAP